MNLTANIKVSIRLMSGGHSFSPEALNGAVERCGEKLTVELVTPKTTLVPASVFRAEDAPSYLAALGLAADVNESVVCSPQIGDVVAVMAISAECLAYLSLLCGDKMSFVTPLLLGYAPKEGAVVELHGEVLYVRIFNADNRQHVHNHCDQMLKVYCVHMCYSFGEALRLHLVRHANDYGIIAQISPE